MKCHEAVNLYIRKTGRRGQRLVVKSVRPLFSSILKPNVTFACKWKASGQGEEDYELLLCHRYHHQRCEMFPESSVLLVAGVA